LRSEERDEGRRGVVGRDGMRVRDAERERVRLPWPKEPDGGGFVGGVVDDIVCIFESILNS
jgi:hypothetical protein